MAVRQPYQDYCRTRKEAYLVRHLDGSEALPQGRLRRDGSTYVNLAGNDYLGLSHHPAVIAAARDYAERYGAGATASRLVCGNLPVFEEIEAQLAAAKGKEAALVLGSGYQTNLTVLAALADKTVVKKPVTILADRLIHHSLLQGALLSGSRLARFRHNDLGHLEDLLKPASLAGHHCIVVSESVFGMDGDRADLVGLSAITARYDAMLYIDEAHATGLFGKNGFGLAADCPQGIDVVMGTFGKALGSFGSYIACSADLRDYLVQRCGGLIYATALPPAVLGAITAALKLVPQLDAERSHLIALAENLRHALRGQGWDCGASTTQIIPVIVGGDEAVLALGSALRDAGFMAGVIRPPTVPQGTARLRLSLSAALSDHDIERLITSLAELASRFAA